MSIPKTVQYYKFCLYGFLKNLRLFDAFFLLFLMENGLTFLQIGWLYTIRQITIYTLEVPSGFIADMIGRRKSLVFSFIAYLISFAIFFATNSYLLFAVAMVAYGIGEAFRSGTHKALILEYLKINELLDIKTRYYGSTRSWSQFGSAISSLLAIFVIFMSDGYRYLFLFTAIPYLLDLLNVATYPRELDDIESRSESFSIDIWLIKPFKEIWQHFIQIFKQGENIRTVFSAASYIALYKAAKDYLQVVLKMSVMTIPLLTALDQDKRTAMFVGIVYFAIFFISAFASKKAWLIEKYLRQLATAINYAYLVGIIGILGSAVFLYFELPVLAALSFLLVFIMQNIRRPLVVSYLSEIFPSKIMASGLSVESQIETILVAVLAPIIGYVVDQIGLAGGLLAAGLFFLLVYPLITLKKRTDNITQ